MKKLLFMMSATAVCLVGLAIWAAAQHVHGTGGIVQNSPVTQIGVKYCEDYPSMTPCSDPKVHTVGLHGAEFECCDDRSNNGGRGGKGGKGGKGDAIHKNEKINCEKLIKTRTLDDCGYPKYRDPKNKGIMMPPCESPVWQNDPTSGPCCVSNEPDKGLCPKKQGKSLGATGHKTVAVSRQADTPSKATVKTVR